MSDYSFDGFNEPPEEVTCIYCGEEGLHWEDTHDGWRLFDADYEPHKCSGRTADATDFKDLDK